MIRGYNTAGFPSLFISIINISLTWFGKATTGVSVSGVSQALYFILMSTWVLALASALRRRRPRASANQQGTEQGLEQGLRFEEEKAQHGESGSKIWVIVFGEPMRASASDIFLGFLFSRPVSQHISSLPSTPTW